MALNEPNSNQTELGPLPADWRVGRLGDLCTHLTVGFVGSMAHLFRRHGIPLLRGQNVLEGRLNLNDMKYVGRDTHRLWRKSSLLPGDVVMVRVGYPGTACVIPESLGPANAASLVVARPESRNLSSRYAAYVINSSIGKKQIDSFLVGGAQQVLNTKTAASLGIPLPPTIEEQEAIAEALSDADALIESLEQLIAKKRLIKQGVMQELLTGKRRLPGFDGEWRTKTLGEICDITMGATPPRKDPNNWGDGHTWLSIADMHGRIVATSKEEITDSAAARILVVAKGTLLMSFKLSIGRLCFAGRDLYTNEAICAFRNLSADARYLYYQLSVTDFALYGKQAVKGYTLNSKSLRAVEVALPEPSEQKAISGLLWTMDDEIEALEHRLHKARQLKQGMMQQLLTGRIRLT